MTRDDLALAPRNLRENARSSAVVGLPAEMSMAKALNAGLRQCLADDPKTVIMGEDVGRLGGVFRITDGLQREFGADRVIDTPLAEASIIGAAVGLAMRGYRPICEIQFDGFVYPGFDQLVSQVAKMHNRTAGAVRLPITVRIPFGGGIGAVEHHSESPEAYFAHTAGLKVVACGNPSDAYWMIQQAVACDDPVIFLEPKRRYWAKAEIAAAPDPLHQARVVRPGRDATIVAYGPMVATALDAADAAETDARDLEVIDLRSISPLDTDTVVASARRTGRVVIAHEASVSFGVGAELAARVQQRAFYHLEAPILRVGAPDTPYPCSRLEEEWLPSVDRILDAVDRIMEF